METLIYEEKRISILTTNKVDSFNNFWDKLEFNRFSIIVIALALVGCLGGIAAGYAVQMDITMLAAVVVASMFTLTMVLAVAPMKYVVYGTLVAVLVDIMIYTSWVLI